MMKLKTILTLTSLIMILSVLIVNAATDLESGLFLSTDAYTGISNLNFNDNGFLFSSGGASVPEETRVSPNYMIVDTIGQFAISTSESPNFAIQQGNWHSDNIAFTLSGTVTLGNFSGDIKTALVTVELGNGTNPIIHNLDVEGRFSIQNVVSGTYVIRIKASHWLAKMTTGVVVSGNTDIGTVGLINGDVVDNNEVDFDDINAVRAAYGSFPGDITWNEMADVDGSGEVDFSDINIVRGNYGAIGD